MANQSWIDELDFFMTTEAGRSVAKNAQAERDTLLLKLEAADKLLRDIRKDLELRAECHGTELVVDLGATLYNRLYDATEPPK